MARDLIVDTSSARSVSITLLGDDPPTTEQTAVHEKVSIANMHGIIVTGYFLNCYG